MPLAAAYAEAELQIELYNTVRSLLASRRAIMASKDAIFSRGPNGVKRTGLFIGGRDIGLAADILTITTTNPDPNVT